MGEKLTPEKKLRLAQDVAAFYRVRCEELGGWPEMEVEALLLAFYACTDPGARDRFIPVGK